MLRGNHSIILLALSATIVAVRQLACADITSTAQATITPPSPTTTTTSSPTSQDEKVMHEQQQKQQHKLDQLIHPSLLVDTKYWIRNTEFGERDNWRDKIKPCTVLERIEFNEQAAISMGDSLDSLGGSLESNLKELTLPMTGVLMLEEDTLNDQKIDSSFIQYLNQSGDCFDTEFNYHYNSQNDDDKRKDNLMFNEQVFKFEPESDHMSWFNPENWRSQLNEEEINDWIPDSHRIPCCEDIVVFGSRHATFNQIVETSERSKTLSFKVNFRTSQATLDKSSSSSSVFNQKSTSDDTIDRSFDDSDDIKVNGLQVSRLIIGDTEFYQKDFQQLIYSKQYENILFQFNDSKSVFNIGNDGFAYSANSLLTLDESSVQSFDGFNLCSDEAGCLCGNENVDIIKTICSFTYSLQPNEQPCYDPITSSGYCSKICATVLTISMDPAKFKEKFLMNILEEIYSNGEQSSTFAENVFSAPRRISNNKYEITFRHVPSDTGDYEVTLGKERDFAELIYRKLNNDAWKTFFGIKTISLRSSTQWRQSSYNLVFWPSLACCLCATLILWTLQEYHNSRIDSNAKESQQRQLGLLRAMNLILRRVIRFRREGTEEIESILEQTSTISLDTLERELDEATQIPLVSLNTNYSFKNEDDN